MTATARNVLRALAPAVLVSVLAGCAGTPQTTPQRAYDPLEGANREVYGFNEGLDRYVLAPAARGWTAITNEPVRRGVDNFFDNLAYPGIMLNDLLQGKIGYAFADTARFVFNTTLGLAGFLDPASRMGLPDRTEDFGQTLGTYGVDSGAYLVIPGLGPSSTRDVTRYPVAYYTNVLTYTALNTVTLGGLTALNFVNTRAQLEGAVRLRNEAALDPYAFTRSSYLQYRRNLVYDGNPPEKEDPYGDLFDELDQPATGDGTSGKE